MVPLNGLFPNGYLHIIKFLREAETKGCMLPSNCDIGINRKHVNSQRALDTIHLAVMCPIFLFHFIWKETETPD